MGEQLPISIPKLFPNWEVYNKVTVSTVSLSRHNDGRAKQTYTTLYTTRARTWKESKVKDQEGKGERTFMWTPKWCFLLYKHYLIKFPQNPTSYLLLLSFFK